MSHHPALTSGSNCHENDPSCRAWIRTRNDRRELIERIVFPYGFWTYDNGTVVVFNRGYDPIFVIGEENVTTPVMGGWAAGPGSGTCYFFDDGSQPWLSTKHHKRVSEVWHVLVRHARSTGYERAVATPDLRDWLRRQATNRLAPLRPR